MKVFWSWQSDNHQESGRHFVRNVLAELALELNSATEDAERPEVDSEDEESSDHVAVDHDTLDVGGSPRIADTILRKIREAAVFVADVTPIGKTVGGKFVPNPNVMIELGYALKVMDVERIVLVMNVAEGAALKRLPFDLRHWRAPASYSLRRDATEERRIEVAKELKEALRNPVKNALKKALQDQREERRRTVREPVLLLTLDPAASGPWPISQSASDPRRVSLVQQIKKKTPLLPLPAQGGPGHSRPLTGLYGMFDRRPPAQWDREEVEIYNSFVTAYYRNYERYLDDHLEFTRLVNRTIEVKLLLRNDGNVPGTSIDVDVSFPEGIVLYDEKDTPTSPKAPEPPPMIPLRAGQAHTRHVAPNLPDLSLRNFHRTTFFYPKERAVRFEVSELKQTQAWTLQSLLISFATSSDIQAFDMDYKIVANETPEPVTGTVNFEFSLAP